MIASSLISSHRSPKPQSTWFSGKMWRGTTARILLKKQPRRSLMRYPRGHKNGSRPKPLLTSCPCLQGYRRCPLQISSGTCQFVQPYQCISVYRCKTGDTRCKYRSSILVERCESGNCCRNHRSRSFLDNLGECRLSWRLSDGLRVAAAGLSTAALSPAMYVTCPLLFKAFDFDHQI